MVMDAIPVEDIRHVTEAGIEAVESSIEKIPVKSIHVRSDNGIPAVRTAVLNAASHSSRQTALRGDIPAQVLGRGDIPIDTADVRAKSCKPTPRIERCRLVLR